MISGSKVHQDDLDKLERTEKEAMDAMKNKDFVKVIVYTIVFSICTVYTVTFTFCTVFAITFSICSIHSNLLL